MSVFIFWIVYLSSQNIDTYTYMYFLKIHNPLPFFLDWYTPPSYTYPIVLVCTNPTLTIFVFCYNQFQHFLPRILIFGLSYPPLPIYHLKMTWNPLVNIFERIRRVSQQSGGPYLKKTQSEWKPEPVSGNGIHVLLPDKYKFTKLLKWKKCWTRQTTHWSHV